MKKLLIYMTTFLLAAPIWAQTADLSGDGSSCDQAIYVTSDYGGGIFEPGTYWFHTWTYDLPLHIVYTPLMVSSSVPTAFVDFTCEPDHYPTNELQQVFGSLDSLGRPNSMYQKMPRGVPFTRNGDSWELFVSESFRDLMYRAGITNDVNAYIKVTIPEEAGITAEPFTGFRDCVADADWLEIDDTLHLEDTPEDGEFWIFPIELWRNDSLTFKWTGTEDAILTLHFTCDIDPEFLGETMLSEYLTIRAGGEYRMSKADIEDLYATYNLLADPKTSPIGGLPQESMKGLFYAYLERSTAGEFVVSITEPELVVGTQELLIDQSFLLDSMQLYGFSTSWGMQNLQFVSSSTSAVRIIIATAPFVDANESSVIAIYSFDSGDTGAFLQLTKNQLLALTEQSSSGFLYVRFYCEDTNNEAVPMLWQPSNCEIETILLHAEDVVDITSSTRSTIYRMRLDDWMGDTLAIMTDGSSSTPIYFIDTCHLSLPLVPDEHVIHYRSIVRNDTYKLSPEKLAEWSDRVDPDGYIYIRMDPASSMLVTFSSIKVKEPEPEPETCKETEYKAQVTVEQYCDTLLPLLPYKWQVYEGREVMIAKAGLHYDTIFSYLSDGTTRCDSVIYTLSLSTVHCERPTPEPPSGGEGEGEGGTTGGGGETGGNQNTPNPPVPGPGFPEPNYPTGSVIYRGAQTISAVCTSDGTLEVRVTKAQELRLMQGSVLLERWTQQPGDVHRLTLREGVTYTLRGLETLYLRR